MVKVLEEKVCGGRWTTARFNSFIVSALRSAHGRWGPKAYAKSRARVRRGVYKCELCGVEGPATLPPLEGRVRRRNNASADHIVPVVDPAIGMKTWDEYITRMFVEEDGYQIICHDCHSKKTKEERDVATDRRRQEKLNERQK